MARTLQRYKKLFDQVKKDALHRIYFLYGPEEYLKKEFITELIKTRLSENNRAFNLDIFHADDFDRDAFADRISSYPLFTERRMVILKNFDALSTTNQDFVLERAGTLAESVILVAETPAIKLDTARLKRLQQIADRGGLSFGFQHLSDDETIERVKTRLHREGYSIAPDALELLVDSVGTNLIDLANEIEKIMLSTDPGTVIGREQVAAVVGKYRTENLFGLLDQMGAPDTATQVAMMHRVLESGEEPVFVLAMMIRRVLQLLYVRLLMDENKTTAKAIAQRMSGSVSAFQATILVDQAKRFETEDLGIFLNNLRWADIRIKSSSVEPRHLLETALLASAGRKLLALHTD
jgi:DNA polymerase-3 subunit delta